MVLLAPMPSPRTTMETTENPRLFQSTRKDRRSSCSSESAAALSVQRWDDCRIKGPGNTPKNLAVVEPGRCDRDHKESNILDYSGTSCEPANWPRHVCSLWLGSTLYPPPCVPARGRPGRRIQSVFRTSAAIFPPRPQHRKRSPRRA